MITRNNVTTIIVLIAMVIVAMAAMGIIIPVMQYAIDAINTVMAAL